MPEIKVKHIVSFSSEDKVFKAENLLRAETYRKWKCATPGEKSVSVVLQFEKATQIHSIDIGNEHSAFVEVLVTRSSDANNDYKVLLVASSFMSPLESRNGTNINRVRMFGPEKLSQNLKDEKWDMVEVVCTQPFNKLVQYGLSFVKFHSPPEVAQEEPTEPKLQLGRFKLKESEEDEESPLQRGAWFQKKRESTNDSFSTSPSAIRQASFAAATLASAENKIRSPSLSSPASIKRKQMDDDSTNVTSVKKRDSSVVHVNREKVGHKNIFQSGLSEKAATSKQETKVKPSASHQTSQASKKAESTGVKKAPSNKPKNQLMEKVVFVLSGFQNPERSMIRDFALEMGARYKADWDSTCTHLVCAFINTPKYTQVRSKGGRIVKSNWILDSYKANKLLPWRKYMLGKYDKSSSSEDDAEEVVKAPPKNGNVKVSTPNSTLNGRVSSSEGSSSKAVQKAVSSDNQTDSLLDLSDDNDSAEIDYRADTDVDSVSGGDTEDEIEKVESKERERNTTHTSPAKQSPKKTFVEHDSLEEDTEDDERPDTTELPLPPLPDFFKRKHFFLYGKFSDKERHNLERYITAYNGVIVDYMGEDVKYVITLSKWNENFDEAVLENDNLIFVHPKWIYRCHENHKLVPYQPHIIVPDE